VAVVGRNFDGINVNDMGGNLQRIIHFLLTCSKNSLDKYRDAAAV